MEAGIERDDRSVVVRVDKCEVVRTHLCETIGVLVDERGLEDRIRRSQWREVRDTCRGDRRGGHVVGPLRRPRAVAHREEEHLDRMREAYIEGLLRVGSRGVGLARRGLHLLNEDITRGASHTLTLVVGDNSVVSPDLSSAEDRYASQEVSGWDDCHALFSAYNGVVGHDEKVAPVTEGEVNTHLVVRKGRGRKGNTAIPAVEEWKREVESKGWNRRETRWNRRRAGYALDHGREVTDHVVVAVALSGRHSEGRPEVQVIVIEPSRYEVVERDATFTDDVVHEVTSPPKVRGQASPGVRGEPDRRSLKTKPGVEQVITSTRDADCPFLVERRRARGARQDNRDLGEPRGLARLTNEIGGSVRATIEVLLNLVEGRKIDEAGGYIGCADGCHFY